MKDNTMIFMFHDSEFFSDLLNQDSNNHDLLNQQGMDCSSITDKNLYLKFMIIFFSAQGAAGNNQKRYGKLLFINFEEFIKDVKGGTIKLKIDETFDCNEDYIEKMSVMSSDRMAVALSSGKVVIRHVTNSSTNICSHEDRLVIPCPENLKEDIDQDMEDVDTEGPSLCSSRNGKISL